MLFRSELYFIEGVRDNPDEKDFLARFVLYATSLKILVDYMPFGSGLASFGTHASGAHYSKVYSEYGIDNVWGLSKSYNKFIADTYYPSLAQFGIAGVILFALFWMYILKKAFVFFNATKKTRLLTIILLVIGYILIENVADATFTSNRGLLIMIFLGLLCAEQKYEFADLQNNTDSFVNNKENNRVCKQ